MIVAYPLQLSMVQIPQTFQVIFILCAEVRGSKVRKSDQK